VGRNDPCPCGSGKKHKRCCGAPKDDPLASEARRVRSILETLEPRILRHAREILGEDALDLAWTDFVLDAQGLDPAGPEIQSFFPWMLYRWVPSAGSKRKSKTTRGMPSMPVSECFREAHRDRLWADEDAILRTIPLSPFGFHEVVGSEPGRALRLRDVIVESEQTVFEQSASRDLRVGDLVYARVVDFDTVSLMIGSGALVLPPDRKIPLMDLRKRIRREFHGIDRDRVMLLGCDEIFRTAYFAFREEILNPAPPTLQNTDGEPLEFHTFVWKVDSDEAFRALAPLAQITGSEAELREEATIDDAGRVVRAEFPWSKAGNKVHAHWTNTTLGHITIDGSKLTIEVNSMKRAELIRSEVARRLGERAFGPSLERRSVEEALREQERQAHSSRGKAPEPENDHWGESPEALEVMRQYEEAHWEAWVTQRIPALGNKKPAQLVKTREGREMVEALLLSFERHGPAAPKRGPAYDLDRVRARLGLSRRGTTP